MIIANPIYDTTFKMIMESDSAAKFFIGTILDCQVLSLVPTTQEHVEADQLTGKITLYRKDFAATIKTDDDEGEKQVIIEIQKAMHYGEIITRFRKYLGSVYSKNELPIIAIYILGYNLIEEEPVFMTYPHCISLRTKETLEIKDKLVKSLTHTSYFIQANRIKPEYTTNLDKLLAIFEQANFYGDDMSTKSFTLQEVEPGLSDIVKILQFVAGDQQLREQLGTEMSFKEELDKSFGSMSRDIEKKEQVIEEQRHELKEQRHELETQRQSLLSTAKELKKMGINVDRISELTGLSVDEIEKL